MRITILGKRWNLKFVPRSQRRGWFGLCTDPDSPHRTITIESGHPPLKELEVTIHEMIHAASSALDEEFVTELANDIARALGRLGWEKPQ